MNLSLLSLLSRITKSISVGVAMSLIEMKTHKIRSLLSVIGVFLGVASLVMMLTLIGGIDKFLTEKMDKWVGSIWIWKKWNPTKNESLEWSRSPGLKLSDGQFLFNNSKYVKDVPQKIYHNLPVILSNQSIICYVQGCDSASLEDTKDNITLMCGRWLDRTNFCSGSDDCIISWYIAEILKKTFHYDNLQQLLRKKVNLGKNRFTIVGIFVPRNNEEMSKQIEKEIFIPLKTMQKYVTGFDPDPGNIQIQITNAKEVKALSKIIALTLRGHHRGVEDFEYQTADWIDKVTSMLNNVSILMTIISCLSLTIGGLSIMNVMLSSISERIHEIGIRKSLGADNIQIFVQFITETITLSLTGGSFGFVFGLAPILFKDAILRSTQGSIEPTILPLHIIITFILITVLGIIFGLYPAIRAARMNPVDALRYE